MILYKNRQFELKFFKLNAKAAEIAVLVMAVYPLYWVFKSGWYLVPLYSRLIAAHNILFMSTQCEKCSDSTTCPGALRVKKGEHVIYTGEKYDSHLLVPLDGSELAESALPHAIHIAKASHARIVLVSVTERIQGFRVIEDRTERIEERLSPEARGKLEKQAQWYLDKIAKQLEAEGVKVDTDVQFGSPSEGIIACSINNKCDIIVMASHGRSGISRWSHGSVADKAFRASKLPVLMVKAPGAVDNLK